MGSAISTTRQVTPNPDKMKFSYVLLAAPFVAGALAAPAVSQNTKDLPTTESDCVAAQLVWDGAACAAPDKPTCAKGEKLKGGECVKAPKNNNKGKNKGKNNNKNKNRKNQNGKKPNKPNKKKPKKPELTEEEKEQKKIEKQEKKDKEEQKKQEKQEKKDEFANDKGCNQDTHDVLGQGDKMKCVEKCDVGAGMYRGWDKTGPMCHDCTAKGLEVVTNADGDSKCKKVQQEKPKKDDPKKEKPKKDDPKKEKPKKDGPKKVGPKKDKPKNNNNKGKGKGKGNDKKDKLTQEEKDQIKQEKEDLKKARDDFATNTDCAGEVFGDDTDENPFVCHEECGENMYRGWNENGPMCHDCKAEGFELVTNKAGEEKCKKTGDKPNMDGDKKGPNNGDGKGPNGDGKGPNGDGKGPNGVGKGPNGDGKGPNGGEKGGPGNKGK